MQTELERDVGVSMADVMGIIVRRGVYSACGRAAAAAAAAAEAGRSAAVVVMHTHCVIPISSS